MRPRAGIFKPEYGPALPGEKKGQSPAGLPLALASQNQKSPAHWTSAWKSSLVRVRIFLATVSFTVR